MLGADFHQLERIHLVGLCSQSIAEDADLDFKQDNGYRKGPDELAKDVTAMANARGGLIIVGVAEDGEGNAVRLTPVDISGGICDSMVKGLRSRVFPFLPPDFSIRSITDDPSTPDLGYILIGVPRSPIAPHAVRRVGEKDQLRYGYARRLGSTTAWLDEAEIATLYRDRFRQAEQHAERVRKQLSVDSKWLASDEAHGVTLILSLVAAVNAERRIDRVFLSDIRKFVGALCNTGAGPAIVLPNALLSDPPQIRRGRIKVHGNGIRVVWHADGGVTLLVEVATAAALGGTPVLNLTHLEHRVLCALHFATAYAEWAGAYGDVDVMASTTSSPQVHLDRTPPNGSTDYTPGVPVTSDASEPCHHVGYLEALTTDIDQLKSLAMKISADLLADYGVYEPTLIRADGVIRSERLSALERKQMNEWLAAGQLGNGEAETESAGQESGPADGE